jgi:hypothetical protein
MISEDLLSPAARRAIATTDAVYVSPIGFFEIGRKVRLEKWPEMAPFAARLVDVLREQGGVVAPLTRRFACARASGTGPTAILSTACSPQPPNAWPARWSAAIPFSPTSPPCTASGDAGLRRPRVPHSPLLKPRVETLTLTQICVAMFSFCPHGDESEQGMNGTPDCRDPTTVE